MYPEAGGSSSFARHAFNEFWSFFAAWAQMLNYVITIAISAFFVPHYLGGLFWSAPAPLARGHLLRHRRGRRPLADQRRRRARGRRPEHRPRRHRLRDPAAARRRRLRPRLLPAHARRQRPLRPRPDWHDFLVAIPRRDDRLHRHRDDLEHGRGGPRRGAHDPQGDQPRRRRRVRHLRRPARSSPSRPCPSTATPDGHYVTLLGVDEAHGGFAGDPVLGIVKHLHLGAFQQAGEIYVGLLAATILFIAANAGIIGVSRLVYSMGLHRQVPDQLRQLHPRFSTPWIGILVFGAIACLTLIPGKADFLGNLYAFGAMLSFTIAHLAVIRLRVKEPDRRAARSAGRGPSASAAASSPCSPCSAASAPASPSSPSPPSTPRSP